MNESQKREDIDFCDGCQWLSLTEKQQDAMRKEDQGIRLYHECRWYHKLLKHNGQHPMIPKLPECTNYVRK